jgi:hypothetical protein
MLLAWRRRLAAACPRARTPTATMPLRCGALLGAVALLHLLVLRRCCRCSTAAQRPWTRKPICVDFIEAPPPMPGVPNETDNDPHAAAEQPRAEAGAARGQPARAGADVDAPRRPWTRRCSGRTTRKLQLFNRDGSMHVPADMLDKLDEKFGDKRAFS